MATDDILLVLHFTPEQEGGRDWRFLCHLSRLLNHNGVLCRWASWRGSWTCFFKVLWTLFLGVGAIRESSHCNCVNTSSGYSLTPLRQRMILFLLQGELKVQRNKVPSLDDPRNPQRSGNGPHNSALNVLFRILLFFLGHNFSLMEQQWNPKAVHPKSQLQELSLMGKRGSLFLRPLPCQ